MTTAELRSARRERRLRATLALYNQANTNFRKLTDIRFKLLALLPLATGVASYSHIPFDLPALSLFGAAVTFAIWVYDQRNNQHYDELVAQAASLERTLGVYGGPFDARPRAWWKLRRSGLVVEHRWPIDLIYGASLVAWLTWCFSAVYISILQRYDGRTVNQSAVQIAWGCVMAAVVWSFYELVHRGREIQSRVQRDETKTAFKTLHDALKACRLGAKWSLPHPEYPDAHDARQLAAILIEKLKAPAKRGDVDPQVPAILTSGWGERLTHYLQNLDEIRPRPGRSEKMAAYILGQMTDLPPRWIEDIQGRRAKSEEDVKPRNRSRLAFGLFVCGACLLVILPCRGVREPVTKPCASDQTPRDPNAKAQPLR